MLRIVTDGSNVREVVTDVPEWIYTLSEQAADGLTGAFDIEVEQISAVFGPGPAARLSLIA